MPPESPAIDPRFKQLLTHTEVIAQQYMAMHPDEYDAAGIVFKPQPELLAGIVDRLDQSPVDLFEFLRHEMLSDATARKLSGASDAQVMAGSGIYFPLLIRWALVAARIYKGDAAALVLRDRLNDQTRR